MLYNLDNILDRERFKRKVNSLYESRRVVELTEKSNRTRSQNSYLHLIIGYLAIERFRNWSSETAGIYLPSANEQSFLDNIEIELSKHKKYL